MKNPYPYPSDAKIPTRVYRRGLDYPMYEVFDRNVTPQEPLPALGPPNDGDNPNYPNTKKGQ